MHELGVGVASDVAHSDARFFGVLLALLDEFLASLFGERREWQPDDRTVVVGVDAELGSKNGLLDGLECRLVPGFDDEQMRVRRLDARDLADGSGGSVVVDLDVVEDGACCSSGAYRRELVRKRFDGLVHVGLGVVENVGRAHVASPLTIVPTRAPVSAFSMLSSVSMLNTRMGSELSMHNEMAVVSMTCRPRLMTSM